MQTVKCIRDNSVLPNSAGWCRSMFSGSGCVPHCNQCTINNETVVVQFTKNVYKYTCWISAGKTPIFRWMKMHHFRAHSAKFPRQVIIFVVTKSTLLFSRLPILSLASHLSHSSGFNQSFAHC